MRKRNNIVMSEKITVREFLLKRTQVKELCVITDSGYIVATAWIDYEDLFAIHPKIADMLVKSHKWDTLDIVDSHGKVREVPCHYIEC